MHRYMLSSPGCWALYGEVLAREYGDLRYMAAHRLTVDAYAVQHPGEPCSQAIQSVAIHLISLHLIFERDHVHAKATRALARLTEGVYEWLTPPAQFEMTIANVSRADSPEEHRSRIEEWARANWQAWSPHHDQIRTWAERH